MLFWPTEDVFVFLCENCDHGRARKKALLMLQSTLASQSHWLVRELYMSPVWHVFLCDEPPAHV